MPPLAIGAWIDATNATASREWPRALHILRPRQPRKFRGLAGRHTAEPSAHQASCPARLRHGGAAL